MKSITRNTSIVALCLSIAFLASPANAVMNELVSSSESHSIEKFNSAGNWIKTFASTGPWIPLGVAVNPATHDVFVATLTNTILRYHSSGAPFGGGSWSSFDVAPYFGSNPVESLLFDSAGNLYVSSHYGTSGYTVDILIYPAAVVTNITPVPGPKIVTTVGRGDQMAFDVFGNICIASFIAPNTVQCYSPSTLALTFDYSAEIPSFPSTQPVGLAFDPNNKLFVTSVFAGQVVREVTEHSGPLVPLASGMVADLGYLAKDSAGFLYTPSFHNPGARYGGSNFCSFYACNDYDFTSDVVYKIDPNTGTVTNFITKHIWGPYQMIFVPF